MNALEAEDLALSYRLGGRRITAVDGVSLAVPEGAVLGIVGESGCGKSSLARVLLGLAAPDVGVVRAFGTGIAGLGRRERARLIQPVFQDPMSSLNPRRRVRDIVALPLVAAGIRDRGAAVADMLARVGLGPELAARYPAELSGGQRQRVAIARALVLRPRIVVCDEPTSALDVSVQAQILNLLMDLRRDLRLTIVFISHNLAVVQHVADAVAVMYLGRIVERGPAEAIFAAPGHPYTRALLDSVLTAEPGLGLPNVGLGDAIPDPAAIPSGCRFHPRCPVAIPGLCDRTSPAASITQAGTIAECVRAASV
jgi:peptide/nickel transport system ATP-binding protein